MNNITVDLIISAKMECNDNVFDFYETSMKDIFPDEITYSNLPHPHDDYCENFQLHHEHDNNSQPHYQACDFSSSDSMLFNNNNSILERDIKNVGCERMLMEEEKYCENSQNSGNSSYDESLAELESKDLWSKLLDSAVLHDDPMMSDTCRSLAKSDHCYSSADDQKSKQKRSRTIADSSRLTVTTKTYRDAKTGSGSVQLQTIKQEPKIITVHTASPMLVDNKSGAGRPAQSLLKGNSSSLVHTVRAGHDKIVYPLARVKSEPRSPSEEKDVYVDRMPITPPSSNQSSDSEGGTSPPTSPVRQVLVARASGYRYNPATAMYSQPIPTSGVLRLTDEEKRTFITEGYPLPAKLPLSKAEERNLKKVRRKIKNKISAQESRRKKKEYMDQLERKVDCIVKENNDLRQKCDDFESNNRSLVGQLHKLQAVLKRISPRQVTAQTGTCLLVMVLCFAVFIGNWSPFSSSLSAYGAGPCVSLDDSSFSASSAVRSSRTLTSLVETPYSYQEPWPIKLARHSLQWSVSLLYNTNSSSVSLNG